LFTDHVAMTFFYCNVAWLEFPDRLGESQISIFSVDSQILWLRSIYLTALLQNTCCEGFTS